MEVRKRENESPTSLMYRFNKKMKQSGILKEVRKRRFSDRKLTKRKRRLSALHREKQRKEYSRKKKLGIL